MSIPSFDKLMLPLLQLTSDGEEHSLTAAVNALVTKLNLTEEDQGETLPSGGQTLRNRVAWARHYLIRSGLLSAPTRGRFTITAKGRERLRTSSSPIMIAETLVHAGPPTSRLEGAEEKSILHNGLSTAPESFQQTPLEMLESSYQVLQHELADDLSRKAQQVLP